MEIKTPRLVIKNLSLEDEQGMIALLKNDDIKKTYMIPDFKSDDDAKAYFNRLLNISNSDKHFLLGVYLDNQIIGMTNDVMIKKGTIELGYFIDPVHWNKGYASEVLKAMIEQMFTLGFKRVIAGHFEENPASGKVMSKCGMDLIDKIDYISYRDNNHKCVYYEILNPKYAKNKKKKAILLTVGIPLASCILTSLIILTFAVFIPQSQIMSQKTIYEDGLSLLENGDYEAAAARFKDNSYADSSSLYYVAKAGSSFDKGDYEMGIDNIHNAGGTVSIDYDPNGGIASKSKEVLNKKCKWIDNNPSRTGYDFIEWKLDSFLLSYNSKKYGASLKLTASWNILTYSITYELNGGTLTNQVSSFNVDTESFVVDAPEKRGYTFNGWTGTDITDPCDTISIEKGSIGDRHYVANFTPNKYTITYDYGYDNLSETQEVTFDEAYILINPSRDYYTFDGWYYMDQKVNDGRWNYTSNIVLIAKWTIMSYQVTVTNPYPSRGSVTGSGSYQYNATATITANARDGYTFLGWCDANNEIVSTDNPLTVIVSSDLAYQVKWNDGNEYTVTLDPNGGDDIETTFHVNYGNFYSFPVPTLLGYRFVGWSDGENIISASGTWTHASDKQLVAEWALQYYYVTYELNGGTNNPLNSSAYTYFSDLTLSEPTRKGYEFTGWYNGENKIETIPGTTASNITIEAHWTPKLNNLILGTSNVSQGSVSLVSGSGYTDEEMVVMATPTSGYTFAGWETGDGIISTNPIYRFTMPAYDYALIAHFRETTYTDLGAEPAFPSTDDLIVTYGLYPTTHVNDDVLIEILEKTEPDPYANNWVYFSGAYYTKAVAENEYVVTFYDGTYIIKDKSYWFKCEPIRWRMYKMVYDETHFYGIYAMSEQILDASTFYDYAQSSIGYNNSKIRRWLKYDFYSTAFVLNSNYVGETLIKDDKDESGYYEKAFIASYDEYLDEGYGFESQAGPSSTRVCSVTDYAKIKNWSGNYSNNCSYFTRTVFSHYSPWFVDEFGALNVIDNGNQGINDVRGIRPCIYIVMDFSGDIDID